MTEIAKYGQLGPRLPFKCKEGNMTIVTARPVGGDMDVPTFASPIEDGTWVKLAGNWLVEPCAASDTECIGRAVGRPQFEGKQPTASKTWGNYDPRWVTVELMGAAVRVVTM